MPGLETILPPIFAFAAIVYLGLAVYVSRSSPQSVIGFLMFLMGVMVAGTAFAYGATDITLFNIGRVMNFAAAALLPVAFYVVYRQFTAGPPNVFVLAMLLMATGGPDAGGIIDYRAWLLLALGILALVIGNFSRTSGRGS